MAGELVLQTLRRVVEILNQAGIPWTIIGGAALSAWDRVRNTLDVDFLVGVDDASLPRLLAALRAAGLRPKRVPPVFSIGSQRLAQFYFTPPETYIDIQVDLLFAESPYQRDALARRKAARFPGSSSEVYIIACEDLIVFKLVAGRMLDLADAVALLQANRAILDFALLRRECERNSLTAELTRVWEEAFSGETLPGAGAS